MDVIDNASKFCRTIFIHSLYTITFKSCRHIPQATSRRLIYPLYTYSGHCLRMYGTFILIIWIIKVCVLGFAIGSTRKRNIEHKITKRGILKFMSSCLSICAWYDIIQWNRISSIRETTLCLNCLWNNIHICNTSVLRNLFMSYKYEKNLEKLIILSYAEKL